MSYAPEPSARPRRKRSKWVPRLLWLALFASLGVNWWLWQGRAIDAGGRPTLGSKVVDGDRTADEKIARIEISGTIMPPLTGQILDEIEAADGDDDVRGVLLVVDSPGGLVADSHRIYHRLAELAEKKPVTTSFGRLAASGGYYVAMGAGPDATIFAEPTTWTGSIGVIIPRYDLTDLGTKLGIESDSLKTGPFKDALNPLQPLSDGERDVWRAILDDAFGKFIEVIDSGRGSLDTDAIENLATGQIYTAAQALENGLVDEIGYDDDAFEHLKKKLGLEAARVIEYQHPTDWSSLLGGFVRAPRDERGDAISTLAGRLAATARPSAYYLFGVVPSLLAGD